MSYVPPVDVVLKLAPHAPIKVQEQMTESGTANCSALCIACMSQINCGRKPYLQGVVVKSGDFAAMQMQTTCDITPCECYTDADLVVSRLRIKTNVSASAHRNDFLSSSTSASNARTLR